MHHSPRPHSLTGAGEGGRINLVSEPSILWSRGLRQEAPREPPISSCWSSRQELPEDPRHRIVEEGLRSIEEPPISSCWSSRQALPEEPRRRTMEERCRSLEGTILDLDQKLDLLEEWMRGSRKEVLAQPYFPAMEPPPPPPPPAPDPYGGYPPLMTASSISDQYQQHYAVQSSPYYAPPPMDLCQQQWPNPTPPSHPLFLQQQQQQYPQYPTPPQPYTNSTSSAWNQQPSSYSPLLLPQHPHGTYGCYPLLYVDPLPPTTMNLEQQQQYQPATYVFDELAERQEACRGLNNEVLISDKMQQPMHRAGHGDLLKIQGNHQPRSGPLINGSDKEVQLVESNGKQYQVCPSPQEASRANASVHAIVVSTLDEYKKASKVLSMLNEDQMSGVGKSGKLSNASPFLAVDTGEPDNFVTEASTQKQVVQSIGELTSSGSLEDDLFGSDLIVDMSTNGSRSEDTVIKEKDNGTLTEEKDGGEPHIDKHTVHEELDKVTIEAENETESGVVQANAVSLLQPDILNSGHVVPKTEFPGVIAIGSTQSDSFREDSDKHYHNSSSSVEDQLTIYDSATQDISLLSELVESGYQGKESTTDSKVKMSMTINLFDSVDPKDSMILLFPHFSKELTKGCHGNYQVTVRSGFWSITSLIMQLLKETTVVDMSTKSDLWDPGGNSWFADPFVQSRGPCSVHYQFVYLDNVYLHVNLVQSSIKSIEAHSSYQTRRQLNISSYSSFNITDNASPNFSISDSSSQVSVIVTVSSNSVTVINVHVWVARKLKDSFLDEDAVWVPYEKFLKSYPHFDLETRSK